MRLLQNPIVLKAVFVFCVIALLFMMAIIFMRLVKKEVLKQDPTPRPDPERAGFSLAAYEGVITKMKEQERELERLRRSEADRARESATVSEAIISNLASGVVLFNTAGLIRQANPAARTLLGYASPSSMHARGIFKTVTAVRFTEDFVSDDANTPAERLVAAIERSIRDGHQFRRVEVDYATPAGDKRVLGITISSVRLPSGDRLGAACLLTDLTDIARLSEQVKLQENMAALGEMSAGIAHEFKNSLATISGYAQMLTQESKSGFAPRIVDETSNLSRIVSDFLNFARPQGNVREPIDMLDLVRDCAEEAHVSLSTAQSGEDFSVLGDPTALRQAISNLLRNSAEAAQGEASVLAKFQSTSARLQLSLIDNGGGIPKESLAKIFIPFFTTKTQGTGLGLALVHRIVTEHGGTIEVESPVSQPQGGMGTAFTLTFPRSTWAKDPVRTASQSE